MGGRYLTPEEAAARLRVSKATVCRRLRDGKLVGTKAGNRTRRIPRKAVEAFLHHDEYDREALTPEQWAEVREGLEQIRRGEYVTPEKLERKYKL